MLGGVGTCGSGLLEERVSQERILAVSLAKINQVNTEERLHWAFPRQEQHSEYLPIDFGEVFMNIYEVGVRECHRQSWLLARLLPSMAGWKTSPAPCCMGQR